MIFSILVALICGIYLPNKPVEPALNFKNLPIVPNEIKQALDKKSHELIALSSKWHERADTRMGLNTASVTLPNGEKYYIKYGIERITNALKVKDVIAKHNLYLLSVPDKYLYHVPGKSEELSDENYLVIAKAIEGKCGLGSEIGFFHVQQLYCLAIEANHYDMHCANYVLTDENKIVIIDTDKYSMPDQETCAQLRMDYLLNGNRLRESGGIRMDPDIINDPITKLELMLYSKWPNFNSLAYAYLSMKAEAREQQRKQTLKKLTELTFLESLLLKFVPSI